jgi:hypothetical protein
VSKNELVGVDESVNGGDDRGDNESRGDDEEMK